MSKLQITVERMVSPWNRDTNKYIHCATRVALNCTSVQYLPEQVDMPSISTDIFVYRWNNHKYVFSHIVSPVELLMLPLKSEVTDEEEPRPIWVRDSKIDLLVPCYEIAKDFLDKVESDIYFLAREISSYKQVVGPDEITVEVSIKNESGTH